MSVVLALGGAWLAVAVLAAVVIGRAVRLADQREGYEGDEPRAVGIPIRHAP